MWKISSYFRVSSCRSRLLTGILLAALFVSFVPGTSRAQQPTAAISEVTGTVLVNGQTPKTGAVLHAGDILETRAGAQVVLMLSEGSELRLGQNTRIDLAVLAQRPQTGARTSYLKLAYGWIRGILAPGHQTAGSSFEIETPNAVVGVKFSQPDVEVSYDPTKQETVGIAHTVELIAINLLTNEKIVVPVGSSVIIVGLLMKVIVGTSAAAIAAATSTAAASTAAVSTAATATGAAAVGSVSAATIAAVGVGMAAVVGGVVAVEASSDGGDGTDGDNPFTGIFVGEAFNSDDNATWINTFTLNLRQNGTSVTGTSRLVVRVLTGERFPDDCTIPLSGTVTGTSVVLSCLSTPVSGTCRGEGGCGTMNCTLTDNGQFLRCPDIGFDFSRQ